MRRPKLVYVVTHPITAAVFLRGQLAFMREAGFDVTVLASPGKDLDLVARREGVPTIAVPIAREPSTHDGASLARVFRAIRALAPDIVNASTPKAALLGLLAARAARVPVRIYLVRGLRLDTATGTLRRVLATTERIAASCAKDVICNSPSLVRAMVDGGYSPPAKTFVLGAGSSNGVDVDRFAPSEARSREGRALLGVHGVADRDPVILFVGRAVKDKGLGDLLDAFARVREHVPQTKLVVVGESFADDADRALVERIRRTPGVVSVGRVDEVAPYYAAADVVAFPSAREGFPNAVLETSASARAVVAYRATGTVDAVVDGVTGTLVAQGDRDALARGLIRYLEDGPCAAAHGAAGRARATSEFANRVVWSRWLELYRERLSSRARSRDG